MVSGETAIVECEDICDALDLDGSVPLYQADVLVFQFTVWVRPIMDPAPGWIIAEIGYCPVSFGLWGCLHA